MEEQILNILTDLCDDSDNVIRENLDLDLFETGLLDSLTFVEFLVRLEDQFNLIIAPSEVVREDINTARKIIYQVQERQTK